MSASILRLTTWAVLLHAFASKVSASDCNQNGVDDAGELEQGTSRDVNGNGVPDECDIERDVFGFAVSSQLDLGPKTMFADLADMDLDGVPDVVAIEPDTARVFLLQDRGALRAVVSMKPSTGMFRGVESGVIEDLDEDGDPDIAAAGLRELLLVRNAGQGRLELEARLENGSDPAYVTAADLNGDGRMDILTANSLLGDLPDNFSIYLNKGGFQLADPLQFAAGKLHGAAVARDFDRDGDIDWALALRDSRAVRVHLNGGSGVQLETVDSLALPADASADRFLAGGLEAADWNGDGRMDLSVQVASELWVEDYFGWYGLPGDGRGGFGEPGPSDPRVGGRAIIWSDFDGDGRVDVASTQSDYRAGTIWISRGLAGGVRGPVIEVTEGLTWNGPRYATPQSLRAADLDRDGDLDLTAFHSYGSGIPDTGSVSFEAAWVRFLLNRGTSDCNRNALLDSAEPDCNRNGWPDECDVIEDPSIDCDQSGFPDICEGFDRNRNGLSDLCEIRDGSAQDCNQNSVPDEQDLEPRFFLDAPYEAPFEDERRVFAILTADFDQDADLDWIAFISPWRMSTGIELDYHENRGLREFVSHRDGLELEYLHSAMAVDLGGDGNQDLILGRQLYVVIDQTARILEQVQVQRNDGSGHFTTWSEHAVGIGAGASWPGLAAGDFDGDGLADVAVVRGDAWVLRGRGDGTLAPAIQAQREQSSPLEGDVATLDADADGDLDLAVAGGAVLINHGDGTFFDIRPFPSEHSREQVLGIAAADFDGDSDVDLLTKVLALNDGSGIFRRGTRLEDLVGIVLARDWDADGDMDALLPGSVRIRLNSGAGEFPDSIPLPPFLFVRQSPLEAVDLDGDGFLELICAPAGPQVLWGQPDRRLPETAFLGGWGGEHGVNLVGVGDLDGDADADLIGLSFVQNAPAFVLGVSNGRGSFDTQPGPPAGDLLPVGTRDLDGDGASELIAREGTRLVVLHEIQGDRVGERIEIELGGRDPFNGEGIAQIADLDGDGDLDVALALSEGVDSWIQPVLTKARRAYSLGQRSPWLGDRLQGVGDFDGDSDVDLLAWQGFKERFVYGNDGAGRFQRRNTAAFTPMGRDSIGRSVVGDWDGDGFDDIAGTACLKEGCHGNDCYCLPTLFILRNTGSAGLEIVESHDIDFSSASIASADMDQDGDPDLLVARSGRYRFDDEDNSNRLEVFLNDGSGRFRPWGLVTVEVYPELVLTGDFDGDRLPDIIVQSKFTDSLSICFNRTAPAAFHDRNADGILDECQTRFRRGDWDGDGAINLSDAVALLGRLFLAGQLSACSKAGDIDDSGSLDISDAVWLLRHLFQGAAAPPEPHASCGADPTPDELPCTGFPPCALEG